MAVRQKGEKPGARRPTPAPIELTPRALHRPPSSWRRVRVVERRPAGTADREAFTPEVRAEIDTELVAKSIDFMRRQDEAEAILPLPAVLDGARPGPALGGVQGEVADRRLWRQADGGPSHPHQQYGEQCPPFSYTLPKNSHIHAPLGFIVDVDVIGRTPKPVSVRLVSRGELVDPRLEPFNDRRPSGVEAASEQGRDRSTRPVWPRR